MVSKKAKVNLSLPKMVFMKVDGREIKGKDLESKYGQTVDRLKGYEIKIIQIFKENIQNLH